MIFLIFICYLIQSSQQSPQYLPISMCFLPLGCLKFVVGLGAITSIIISLGLLIITIYANIEKKVIISNTGGDIVNIALVGLYLGAIIFMILGICGVYGALKAKKKEKNSGNCLLFFYLIGVLIFFVIFTAGTVFFFVGPQTIFGTDCTRGSKTTLVDELYNLTNNARDNFCTSSYQCYISDENSYLAGWLRDNGRIYNTVNTTAKNYQSLLPKEQNETSNVILMGALEELLECAGWCKDDTIPRFYRFYDINKCTAKDCLDSRESCHQAFQGFLTTKGQVIGFGCAAATLICLLNIITVCCICNHPTKSKKSANFYNRMMDQE